MILRLALVVAAGVSVSAQSGSRGQTFAFDADRAGTLPAGFTLAAMRQPQPGVWQIRRDGANGLLAHAAQPAATGFGLALATDGTERDISATVRIRFAGTVMSGGLVWRYVDPANFYATILDLSRRQLVLFRVTGGNRVFLEAEDDLELDPAAWHTLKIVHDDDEIHVSLGGIRVFEDRERRGERRPGGRTGLIAGGASDVWFDDLRVEPRR
jgi:hypothetical protein